MNFGPDGSFRGFLDTEDGSFELIWEDERYVEVDLFLIGFWSVEDRDLSGIHLFLGLLTIGGGTVGNVPLSLSGVVGCGGAFDDAARARPAAQHAIGGAAVGSCRPTLAPGSAPPAPDRDRHRALPATRTRDAERRARRSSARRFRFRA